MRILENVVNKRVEDVYLCGIYQKTNMTNDIGEPLYKMVIGARMGEFKLGGWHFGDKEHDEMPHGLHRWYSEDFARDDIEGWSRNGHLENE